MNDRNPRTPFQEAVSMISIASVLVGIGCYVAAINEVPLVSEYSLLHLQYPNGLRVGGRVQSGCHQKHRTPNRGVKEAANPAKNTGAQ
jgi:hypothetical protein